MRTPGPILAALALAAGGGCGGVPPSAELAGETRPAAPAVLDMPADERGPLPPLPSPTRGGRARPAPAAALADRGVHGHGESHARSRTHRLRVERPVLGGRGGETAVDRGAGRRACPLPPDRRVGLPGRDGVREALRARRPA